LGITHLPKRGIPATVPDAFGAHMDAGREHVMALLRLEWRYTPFNTAAARGIAPCATKRARCGERPSATPACRPVGPAANLPDRGQ
jgi:hypothetical protein